MESVETGAFRCQCAELQARVAWLTGHPDAVALARHAARLGQQAGTRRRTMYVFYGLVDALDAAGNARMPNEMEPATQYGVSSTIRRTLHALQVNGLVCTFEGRSTFVTMKPPKE